MTKFVMPAKAGISLLWNKIPAFAGMTILLFSFPAFADAFTYSPAHCDFSITFPEKPFIEEKCTGDQKNSCDDVVSFTQTHGTSSLNFRITCLQDDPKILSSYESTNLASTLDEMVKDSGLQSYTSDAAQLPDGTKTAVNLAGGTRNGREVIYTGQVWLGKQSIFSLEGEMSGPQNKAIDDSYSRILKSVKPKSPKP